MNIKPINNSEMVSSQMNFNMTLHGVLLWASLGFLMPIGILIIRMSNTRITRSAKCSSARLKLFFYSHLILQIVSVLLSTAGAIMSIKCFENSFSNNHQRLGLALHCSVWVQAMLGFTRPLKGNRKRGAWYFLHWLLGTTILIMGIINTYTGLQAYQRKTSNNTKIWTILFTAQVSFMAAFYLFQDKWNYIQKQQEISITNTSIDDSDTTINTAFVQKLENFVLRP